MNEDIKAGTMGVYHPRQAERVFVAQVVEVHNDQRATVHADGFGNASTIPVVTLEEARKHPDGRWFVAGAEPDDIDWLTEDEEEEPAVDEFVDE